MKKPYVTLKELPKTRLSKSSFEELPNWNSENYEKAFENFKNSCNNQKTKNIYQQACLNVKDTIDAKAFFERYFIPFKICGSVEKDSGNTLLTGYYETTLNGSLKKHGKYIYPVYGVPKDLIDVKLDSVYPQLKTLRLRGRVVSGKLVPYYTREQIQKMDLDAEILCYVDSKIELFFLEVQGSGRIVLDNSKTIFVGYANQNGYKYRSIGKYLVEKGEISLKDISLQSIKEWLQKHPKRVDEVLNYNKSYIFFKLKKKPATGSLGIVLTPNRSVAVDREYIPLGALLYLSSNVGLKDFDALVMAHDTGGAIKGALRADMFCGYGTGARKVAGELKSPLKLWILLPKERYE